jgi:hypothetical protein
MIQDLIEKELEKSGLKTKVRYSTSDNAFTFNLKYEYILSIIRKRLTIRNIQNNNVEILAFDYTNLVYRNEDPKIFILIHLPKKEYPKTLPEIINIIKQVENSNNLKEYFKNIVSDLLK